MGKIEEGGASVGSMLPVSLVDEVLTKQPTTESVDAEFNALQLNNKPENVPSEQDVELPAGVPQADDPMNPNPELPEEEPATKEDIESLRNLEAEMESYFSDIDYGDLYEESVHSDMNDKWKKYFREYNASIKNAKKFLKSKKYDKAIESAKKALDLMKKCKKEIENIHPDVFESVFGLILRSAVYTLEDLLVSVITFGFGSIVLLIKECITRLSGILETYKKIGFDIEMVDMYKMNLIGCTTVLIKYADEIIIKAKNEKSSKFEESSNDEITGEEYLYLEDCMKEIDSLCKTAGIISPSTSVKEGEDLYVYEGCEKDGGDDSSLFLESGDKADIDEDIKPIIKTLNDKGYKTISSCSGHPSARAKDDRYRDGVRYKKLYSTARIVFDKIYDFPSIPNGWVKKVMEKDNRVGIYVDPPEFKIIDGLPEKNYANWKRRYMRSLEKWANELPNEGETKDVNTSELSLESVMEDLVTDAMVGNNY